MKLKLSLVVVALAVVGAGLSLAASLLQTRGNHATQQVLAQTGRGHPSEHQPPLPPQRIEPERTDAIDLSRDRGWLSPAPPHDQALGGAAVVSGSMAPGLPPPAIR